MSEKGAEIPKPAWLKREQARLEPKKVKHVIETGPLQPTPSYREKIETIALKQSIKQGQEIRKQTQPLSESKENSPR